MKLQTLMLVSLMFAALACNLTAPLPTPPTPDSVSPTESTADISPSPTGFRGGQNG